MKLLKCSNHTEGQVYTLSAFIQVGKRYDYTGERNGWYGILNLPFITKVNNNYLDPNTHVAVPTVCLLQVGIFSRKPRNTRKSKINYSYHWCPIHLLYRK